MRTLLCNAFNATEATVHSELEHVGKVLDGQIAAAQTRAESAVASGDTDGLESAAWDTFALLRRRLDYDVPTAPAELRVRPTPLRQSFGVEPSQ